MFEVMSPSEVVTTFPQGEGVHEPLNCIQSRVGAAFSPGGTTHILKGVTPQSGSFGSLNTKCKTASYPTNSQTNPAGTEPGEGAGGSGPRGAAENTRTPTGTPSRRDKP